MKLRSLVASLGLLSSLACAAPETDKVTVQFVESERYTDAGDRAYDAKRNLATLERHLVKLGGDCLPADERLALRILDVDLAGREEWWHGPSYDLRVMREVSWPRLEVEYVLGDADGKTLAQGREQVADMDYLRRSPFLRSGSASSLPYEKAMLRDWLGKRFCDVPRRE